VVNQYHKTIPICWAATLYHGWWRAATLAQSPVESRGTGAWRGQSGGELF